MGVGDGSQMCFDHECVEEEDHFLRYVAFGEKAGPAEEIA